MKLNKVLLYTLLAVSLCFIKMSVIHADFYIYRTQDGTREVRLEQNDDGSWNLYNEYGMAYENNDEGWYIIYLEEKTRAKFRPNKDTPFSEQGRYRQASIWTSSGNIGPYLYVESGTGSAADKTNTGTTCYYDGAETGAYIKIKYKKNKPEDSKVYIDRTGFEFINIEGKKISNWGKSSFFPPDQWYKLDPYNGNTCPNEIIVVKIKDITTEYFVYANTQQDVKSWCSELDADFMHSCHVYYGTYRSDWNEEQYLEAINGGDISNLIININPDDSKLSCDIFGDVNHAGSNNEPPSLAYMIHSALSIARIVVIAIVITLGIVDFGKAVISGNEDEMKKNQKRFIKRIIACVIVFLVPMIVDIIMNLIDELANNLGDQCKDFL